MKKFLLIDGNALIHRAYHAMPDLTNGQGEMVNAIYGFFSMFLNILSEQKPNFLAICFDKSKPTIRQAMYAGYHAHRPEMTDGLSLQFTKIHELLKLFKAAMFSIDGYEGDDLIGTLATQAQFSVVSSQLPDSGQSGNQSVSQKDRKTDKQKNQHLKTENREQITETIIVTGDRDMLQLVNKQTKVLMPIIGLSKTILYDEEKVEEKYGVKPSQFVDYKALIGDSSDGYPGVTGIGPKTASNLLKQYGTFENLYEHMKELPEKIGVMLATDAEQAALAKKLATIICDAPITTDFSVCDVKKLDLKALRDGFASLNFKSLVTRLESKYPELAEKKKEITNGQLGLLD